jgi:FdhD protein
MDSPQDVSGSPAPNRAGTEVERMGDPLGLSRLGYAKALLQLEALRRTGPISEPVSETIAEEVPVALVYNGEPHVVMMATPQDLEDFALGFSYTEELIARPEDIRRIDVVGYSRGIELQITTVPECADEIASRGRKLTGRTGCGICGAESFDAVMKQLHRVGPGEPIRLEAVQRAMQGIQSGQQLNAAAGAVHAAGWATREGTVELVREDVGRHNALDKLIGALLKRGTDPASGFVVITSRASFEMVQKTTVLGAPLLAAISGPTGLAVRVAQQAGLTLLGFARGNRATVYTHPDRLTS